MIAPDFRWRHLLRVIVTVGCLLSCGEPVHAETDCVVADEDSAQARLRNECVVLLHGLARSTRSMRRMESTLQARGYQVANTAYPSRRFPIETLAADAVDRGLKTCLSAGAHTIHFVSHSLGGILIRYRFRDTIPESLGRVVMLGPPNHGSEVVDALGDLPGFSWLNGPAGLQLGTDGDSIPAQLGAAHFPLGIIAGTRSINLVLSQFLPNPDDGKVSVENTKLDGMTDFLTLPVAHPFLPSDPQVIRQTMQFLDVAYFDQSGTAPADCR